MFEKGARSDNTQAKLLGSIDMEIEGWLDQSLHNAVWLTLGLERQDFRVRRPWGATLKQPNQQPQGCHRRRG